MLRDRRGDSFIPYGPVSCPGLEAPALGCHWNPRLDLCFLGTFAFFEDWDSLRQLRWGGDHHQYFASCVGERWGIISEFRSRSALPNFGAGKLECRLHSSSTEACHEAGESLQMLQICVDAGSFGELESHLDPCPLDW